MSLENKVLLASCHMFGYEVIKILQMVGTIGAGVVAGPTIATGILHGDLPRKKSTFAS